MLNTLTITSSLSILVLLLLCIWAIKSGLSTLKSTFTASDTSRFARAKQLILRRKAVFDKEQGTVWARDHMPWLEEAKVFQKTD